MIDPRYILLKELFLEALDLPESERAPFLQLRADAALQSEVMALLQSHGSAGRFLDPQDRLDDAAPEPSPSDIAAVRSLLLGVRPGLTIDRYHLLEEIGEGGFGIVYRAEQTHPVRRQVALKVIKLGADTAHVVARFEAECQALAVMEHPSIARMFDAGTTESGRPYFVMELVAGTPLTQYCRQNHLSIHSRVELFVRVCQAVQHAHLRGIIHRDLKPSNILVTEVDGAPAPKIIDFGVARAVAMLPPTDAEAGVLRVPAGTPRYMSPEQRDARNSDVDTRTDVYSLGVILSEMLVDAFEPDARAEAQSMDRELGWISARATAIDRQQRYQTVSELADDALRYLDGDIVDAGPHTLSYRARKTISRHRRPILVTATVMLSLTAGLIAALLGMARANAATHEKALELHAARIAQARAGRFSGRPGQRYDGLKLLAEAAQIDPSLAVRNEAIACLALTDIRPTRRWDGHASLIEDVTFNSALTRYARSDGSGNIQVRSAQDDHVLLRLTGQPAPVGRSFQFSPDERFLLASYHKSELPFQVWDLMSGKVLFRGPPHVEDQAIGLSPDGSLLAYAEDPKHVAVVETTTWSRRALLTFDTQVHLLRFTPDGKHLTVCPTGSNLRVVDIATGQITWELNDNRQIAAIAWSPGGNLLAYVADDKRINIWNVRAATIQAELEGHLSRPLTVTFSPDGRVLVSTAWDETIRLWDPLCGRQLLVEDNLPFVKFATDNRRFVTAGGGFAEQFDLATSQECRNLSGPRDDLQTVAVAVSRDNKLIAAAGAYGVRFWSLATGEPAGWINAPGVRSIIFPPDGSGLLTRSAVGMQRWPIPTTAPSREERDAFVDWGSRAPAAQSGDGRTVVMSTAEGNLLCSTQSALDQWQSLGHNVGVPRYVSVSPDGRWAATSRRADTDYKIWDLKNHQLALRLATTWPTQERGAADFSPDGQYLITADPDFYRLWHVGTWQLAREFAKSFPASSGGATFSDDGKLIAVTGTGQDITLIDPQSGAELATLSNPEAHELTIFCFTHDSRQLVVGNNDSTVTVWNLALIREELAAMHLDWPSH